MMMSSAHEGGRSGGSMISERGPRLNVAGREKGKVGWEGRGGGMRKEVRDSAGADLGGGGGGGGGGPDPPPPPSPPFLYEE